MRIAKRFDPKLDTMSGVIPDVQFTWKWPSHIRMVKQRLTKDEAIRAQKYINCIIRRNYPFQIRELMGRQLWFEFCEYWAINPDFERSLRYL